MAIRSNHYDAAFEDWLRSHRVPYVAVDEKKRALFGAGSVKSMDFIVDSGSAGRWLVDVKGRQFPGAGGQRWENWATADDLCSLLAWQEVFGTSFRSLLVFAYHLREPNGAQTPARPAETWPESTLHTFRHRKYAFFGVWVDQFHDAMRDRSASWNTVWLRRADFESLRFPLGPLLAIPPESDHQPPKTDGIPPENGLARRGISDRHVGGKEASLPVSLDFTRLGTS